MRWSSRSSVTLSRPRVNTPSSRVSSVGVNGRASVSHTTGGTRLVPLNRESPSVDFCVWDRAGGARARWRGVQLRLSVLSFSLSWDHPRYQRIWRHAAFNLHRDGLVPSASAHPVVMDHAEELALARLA
eukprot:2566479-Rhodomonas_salina.5